MIYFDAAYIAKCYLNEPGAEQVIALAAKSNGLCSSEFGRLEFFSALHRHLREGHLTRQQTIESWQISNRTRKRVYGTGSLSLQRSCWESAQK